MTFSMRDDAPEVPTCARCDGVGTSLVVEAGEDGKALWLCQRHLARLRAHAETVPELDGAFDGALVVTEIKADGQGRAQ